jgi:DNA anti-recombination protein RmuC
MTGWDVLNTVMKAFPPFVAALLLITAGVVFIVGFGRHGTNFLRYGFRQIALDSSFGNRFDQFGNRFDQFANRFDQFENRFDQFENRFDQMETNLDARFAKIDGRFEQIDTRFEQIDDRFGQIDARFGQIDVRFEQIEGKIETIEINHFGHLKNYLGLLNGILLDHELVDNTMKARLDNELRGM